MSDPVEKCEAIEANLRSASELCAEIQRMVDDAFQSGTLFGVPVIHSSNLPSGVEVTFKRGFIIEEDDAHRP